MDAARPRGARCSPSRSSRRAPEARSAAERVADKPVPEAENTPEPERAAARRRRPGTARPAPAAATPAPASAPAPARRPRQPPRPRARRPRAERAARVVETTYGDVPSEPKKDPLEDAPVVETELGPRAPSSASTDDAAGQAQPAPDPLEPASRNCRPTTAPSSRTRRPPRLPRRPSSATAEIAAQGSSRASGVEARRGEAVGAKAGRRARPRRGPRRSSSRRSGPRPRRSRRRRRHTRLQRRRSALRPDGRPVSARGSAACRSTEEAPPAGADAGCRSTTAPSLPLRRPPRSPRMRPAAGDGGARARAGGGRRRADRQCRSGGAEARRADDRGQPAPAIATAPAPGDRGHRPGRRRRGSPPPPPPVPQVLVDLSADTLVSGTVVAGTEALGATSSRARARAPRSRRPPLPRAGSADAVLDIAAPEAAATAGSVQPVATAPDERAGGLLGLPDAVLAASPRRATSIAPPSPAPATPSRPRPTPRSPQPSSARSPHLPSRSPPIRALTRSPPADLRSRRATPLSPTSPSAPARRPTRSARPARATRSRSRTTRTRTRSRSRARAATRTCSSTRPRSSRSRSTPSAARTRSSCRRSTRRSRASSRSTPATATTRSRSTTLGGPWSFDGGTGSDTLTGPDADTNWILSGADAGTIEAADFKSFETLVGRGGFDRFVLEAGGSVTNPLNGGAGTDELIAKDIDNAWVIDGANTGTLNGVPVQRHRAARRRQPRRHLHAHHRGLDRLDRRRFRRRRRGPEPRHARPLGVQHTVFVDLATGAATGVAAVEPDRRLRRRRGSDTFTGPADSRVAWTYHRRERRHGRAASRSRASTT